MPSQAVWAGGVDGGVWFLCVDAPAGNSCTIYNDVTGAVWTQGVFRLRGSSEAVSVKELRFSAFDGASIYLLDGRVLDRVK